MLWNKCTQQKKNGGNIYNARNCGISIDMKIPKNSVNKFRALSTEGNLSFEIDWACLIYSWK